MRSFTCWLFAAIILLSAEPAASMEMELEVFRVYYRKAADLVEPLKAVASRHGRLVAEEISNTLIVRDYPPNMAAIKRLLKKLDARPQNVRITVSGLWREESSANWTWMCDGFFRTTTGPSAACGP